VSSRNKEVLDIFEEWLDEYSPEPKKKKKKDSTPKESIPYEMLCFTEGPGEEWFLDPVSRTMKKVGNNVEVVRISSPDKNGKVIVRYANGFLLIPSQYVIEIGFN